MIRSRICVMRVFFFILTCTCVTLISTPVFSATELKWQLKNYDFSLDENHYKFTGTYTSDYESYGYHDYEVYSLEANCFYYRKTGRFVETLTIWPIKYISKSLSSGETSSYYPSNRPNGDKIKWQYRTSGNTEGGPNGDPWLYYRPGRPWPQCTTTTHHSYTQNWPAGPPRGPFPRSLPALFQNYLQGRLQVEAMDSGPKEKCDYCLTHAYGVCIPWLTPEIISPAVGHQSFKNGHVTFHFRIPCEFSQGNDKHAFVVTLERCVTGCYDKQATITINKNGKHSKRPKLELWEPVAVPLVKDNTIPMTPNMSLGGFETSVNRAFDLPYDGEGQLFRLKVEAHLWNGKNYITFHGPEEWRYFWVGKNLRLPDLVISKLSNALTHKDELLLNICVKDQSISPLKRIGLKRISYTAELDIKCQRNGKPYPGLSRTEIVYVPSGGESCIFFTPGNDNKPVTVYSDTTFRFDIKVDPSNKITEGDESNNSLTKHFTLKGRRSLLEGKIWVIMPQNTEWKRGRQYMVHWRGLVRGNRRVRVFLRPISSGGPEKEAELSPSGGFPFDQGGHVVLVPETMPSGNYRIYLEMADVPKYSAYSKYLVRVIGGLKPGTFPYIEHGKRHSLGTTIHFITPSGGLSCSPGKHIDISWKNPVKKPERIRLLLHRMNLPDVHVTPPNGVVNTGRYPWRIPSHIGPGRYYLMIKDMKGNTLGTVPLTIAGTKKIKYLAHPKPTMIRPEKRAGAPSRAVSRSFRATKPPTTVKPSSPRNEQRRRITGLSAAKKVKFLRLGTALNTTLYIGRTYTISWQASGIQGRIRVILESRSGRRQTINGALGTDVKTGRFLWRTGNSLKPESSYRIYLETLDGKIKSPKSPWFKIQKKTFPGTVKNLSVPQGKRPRPKAINLRPK